MVLRWVIYIQALCISTYILIICKMSVAKSISGFVSLSLTKEEQERLCHNFTVGKPEKKEFYSPNYPEHYPSDITCIKQITADFGHVVQLDFRDIFEIEESNNCENDRLEVRDGPYGYSPLLKDYCKREFPNLITSSDRYLWLRFISDDSIEHVGFHAVYEFIPVKDMQRPPIEECIFLRTGPSGNIEKSEIDISRYVYARSHDVPIDCTWIITAEPKRNIYMIFTSYELKAPNECDKNYIEVYPERRIESDREHRFCGTSAEPMKSKTHKVHIRLFMHSAVFNDTKFSLHYTIIRDIKKGESCDSATEFDCNDNTCVDISLKCDKQNDCKYHSDEDKATTCIDSDAKKSSLTSEHMIVILVVFFALVIAMCTSISMSCYNKVQERKAREREYKARRSKEASVEGTTDRSVRSRPSPDRGRDPSVGSTTSKRATANLARPHYDADDDDDESSDGCYVPQVDLSAFQKHPNGGGPYIPRASEGRSVSRGGGIQSDVGKNYPFISRSTDSIESDTVATPGPPPVPMHLKDRKNEPAPTQQAPYTATPYRFVGGKAVPASEKTPPQTERKLNPVIPAKPESNNREVFKNRWPPEDRRQPPPVITPISYGAGRGPPPEARTIISAPNRGPLEAGAPRTGFGRNPNEYRLPRFEIGTARPSTEAARGPLASRGTDKAIPLSIYKPPESYGNTAYRPSNTYRDYKGAIFPEDKTPKPHQFRAQAKIETSDRDSSRADSMESTQSAPDVIAQR